MNYVDAINQVLKHEGGFVNHALDKGGATNFGITQKVYEEFKGRKVSVDEVRSMTRSEAIAIYKKNYWDKIQGDKIKLYSIAFAIFDQAVNRGVSTAIKQAQKIIGAQPDGVLGPSSLNALNSISESDFLYRYLSASSDAYKNIVKSNPSQGVFLAGWLNRVNSLQNYTTQFIGQNQTTVSLVAVALVIGTIFILTTKARTA